MTRIEFYLLSSDTLDERVALACRLCETATRQRERVHIHCDDPTLTKAIDQALWAFRTDSFLPHQTLQQHALETTSQALGVFKVGEPLADDSPVTVGCNMVPAIDRTVLINLACEVPSFFSRFRRAIEIVSDNADIRELARKRYQYYQQRGYPLQHRNL